MLQKPLLASYHFLAWVLSIAFVISQFNVKFVLNTRHIGVSINALHYAKERIRKVICRGRNSHIKKRWACSSYLLRVKNAVLVPFRVFRLQRSTTGAFAEPFRVLSLKIYDSRYCVVLELAPIRGEKHFKPRPQNSWYLLGFLFSKFPTSIPVLFLWESPGGNLQFHLKPKKRSSNRNKVVFRK